MHARGVVCRGVAYAMRPRARTRVVADTRPRVRALPPHANAVCCCAACANRSSHLQDVTNEGALALSTALLARRKADVAPEGKGVRDEGAAPLLPEGERGPLPGAPVVGDRPAEETRALETNAAGLETKRKRSGGGGVCASARAPTQHRACTPAPAPVCHANTTSQGGGGGGGAETAQMATAAPNISREELLAQYLR